MQVGNRGTAGVLSALSEDVAAEKRALAESLRELFTALDMSIRRYAARHHLDTSTVSRYLQGKRVPQWSFVTQLMDDLRENGRPPTPDVVELLRVQHGRALGDGSPRQKLQELQHQLALADQRSQMAEKRRRQLTRMLRDQKRELSKTHTKLLRLDREREEQQYAHEAAVVAWEGHYDSLREQRDQLRVEVGALNEELVRARDEVSAAEQQCAELERELATAEQRLGKAESGLFLVEALETVDRTTSVPELVELVTRLNTAARMTVATELVKSATATRAVREVAVLIESLYAARHHRHAEAALSALVLVRPVADTASLISELAFRGLQAPASTVIQSVIEMRSTHDVVSIVAVIDQFGLNEYTNALLGAAMTTKSIDAVVELLGLLDSFGMGHLIESAVKVCARERPVWDLADLIASLEDAPLLRPFTDQLERAAATGRSAQDIITLVDALSRRLTLDHAEHVLQLSTAGGAPERMAALIAALHIGSLRGFAVSLLSSAVREWPVANVAKLIVELRVASNWQHAVNALAEAARAFTKVEFASLIDTMEITTNGGVAVIFDEVVAIRPYEDLVVLIKTLELCGFPQYADSVFWKTVRSRPIGLAGNLAGALRVSGTRQVWPETLRMYARNLPLGDIVLLSLVLESAGLRADVQAQFVDSTLPHSTQSFFALVFALTSHADDRGQKLAEDLVRETARSLSVDESVEMALALKASKEGQPFEMILAEAVGGIDSKSEFQRRLKSRTREVRREAENTAKENLRRQRKALRAARAAFAEERGTPLRWWQEDPPDLVRSVTGEPPSKQSENAASDVDFWQGAGRDDNDG